MTFVDRIAGPDGDLADMHRLLAAQWPAQGQHAELSQLRAAWQNPQKLRAALVQRAAEGFKGVIVLGETVLFDAITTGRGTLPELIPIVPNIQGLMRDAVEHGMVGAGLRRVWRAGALALAGMGLRNIKNVGAIRRRDFPTLLKGFIELEMAGFAAHHPPLFLLQAQMTDLAIAGHNPRLLQVFFDAAQARGSAAGLITNNATATISALKTWGLEPACLITPYGAADGLVRGDREAAIHALRACGVPVWADRALAPTPPTPADRTEFKRAGLLGACRDDLATWLSV